VFFKQPICRVVAAVLIVFDGLTAFFAVASPSLYNLVFYAFLVDFLKLIAVF